ncbi:pirin family protein [Flavobacterium restrictum]|uniref:Quercetin 2,3-dioxygenase C-terminal cupin domain-containing protein n=1 Tax=Flavobacterium restrictum TaxID=2594428 RepID=A0A553DRN7_9FLAO|nr:hypothetical protein [Flavobacterium restrictum]TRX35405.1 hypothetical protein FNW21_15215 [Flavobacterium restrictum]
MAQQDFAQIYKSEVRGVTATENFKRWTTFNFEEYQEVSRKPFGALRVFNEEVLAPNQRMKINVASGMQLLVLPLFGGVDYTDNLGNKQFIRVEQIGAVLAQQAMTIELCNSYEKEQVSYLQIWLSGDVTVSKSSYTEFNFGFTQKNSLISIFESSIATGFIGIYDGRKEGIYTLKNPSNGAFVFVINGAFEVENRLLESKDGLRLQGIPTVAWEALSNDAVLLIFEISLI